MDWPLSLVICVGIICGCFLLDWAHGAFWKKPNAENEDFKEKYYVLLKDYQVIKGTLEGVQRVSSYRADRLEYYEQKDYGKNK